MDTNNTNGFNNFQQEDTIDIKALVFQALSYWKLFVLSVVIALFTAHMFNKYADPDYEAKATIMVGNDMTTQNPLSNLMPSVFGPPPINMQNEIAILKSFAVAKKAVLETDWQISLYRYGKIRENQMFSNQPFYVELDTHHLQATQVKIDIVLLSSSEYRLIIPPIGSAKLYDYRFNEVSEHIDSLPQGENKVMRFGEKYQNGCFSFTLHYLKPYNDDKEFYFYLNSLEYLARKYKSKFQAKMAHNDATLIEISMKDESQENAMNMINALAKAYVKSNLEDKNQQATNSLLFIDQQLYGIEDSLKEFENDLQTFRMDNSLMKIEDISSQVFDRLYELDKQKALAELHSQYYNYLEDYIKGSNKEKENLVAPAIMDINEPMLIQLVTQLNTLYLQRNQFGSTTTSSNPVVKDVDQQIRTT
ncbi:MAG: hypothetical protein JXR34_03380, partial [Bacteroidales bacterium]|nr:hypothetical protein [Bacteroidales bacterium]